MIRDQLYNTIVSRLSGTLDSELFERCAASLLKVYHPSLVPVRGGSDAGKDGLIADNEGTPFPLVSTTSPNAIGNLTRNLKKYVEEGGARRLAVFATSCELSDKKRRNLIKRASELEFTLVGIYDQAAFSDLLYKDSKWRLELLNLTGDLPALSVLPLSKRPLVGDNLIGREIDLAWLQDTEGDLLLSGQPGSGKTFIFHSMTKSGDGLFLISEDSERIANCIREESPQRIFVDDAHINTKLIENLIHIRNTIGADFKIIANCWPGDTDNVQVALGISNRNVRELNLLTRDQMLDVVKSTGIHGPNQLLYELITQANGKPGLAITLCQLVKNDGIRDVTLGDALSVDVRNTFETLIGEEAIPVLAAFALGGDYGMKMQVVCKALDIPLYQLQTIVTRLASGGILNEVNTARLSVMPVTLRYTLTRDVFLSGPASLPQDTLDYLLVKSHSVSNTTLTLIGAIARGGDMSEQKLIRLIEQINDNNVWVNYAWLGKGECDWVLDEHPEKLIAITNPALAHAGKKVIPMLLSAAINDHRETHSSLDHPLRKIKDWIEGSEPGTGEATQCRITLINAVLEWVEQTHNWSIALRAIKSAFSPKFSTTESDPGIGMTVTFREGCLQLSEMKEIMALWPKVFEHIESSEIDNWTPLMEMIENWAYPSRIAMGKGVPNDISQAMVEFAQQMCDDLNNNRPEHNGILRKTKDIMRHYHYSNDGEINPEFETLFPFESYEDDWQEKSEQQHSATEKLAEKWAVKTPEVIAELIETYEQQAESVGIDYPRLSPIVCHKLSTLVDAHLIWATIFHNKEFYPDLIEPFLKSALFQNKNETEKLLETCLLQNQYRYMAISIILSEETVDPNLVGKAMDLMDKNTANMLRFNFRTSPLAEGRVQKLLKHTNKFVVENAAFGEWNCDPKGEIRDSLKAIWKDAIIRDAGDNGAQAEMKQIFKSDPTIARKWLACRIDSEPDHVWYMEYAAKEAFNVISDEDKKYLFPKLKDRYAHASIALRLVGDNIDLYAHYLTINLGEDLHLAPLNTRPIGNWIDMAVLALDAGYLPEDIVRAAYGHGYSHEGKISDMWQGWLNQFDALCLHTDSRVKEIGDIGKKMADNNRSRAIINEHKEEVFGIR